MDPPCVARENGEAGERSCTNVSGLVLEPMLRTIMDISARASSLAERPQRAKRVTSVRVRREDRTSITSRPLADLGRWFTRLRRDVLRNVKLVGLEGATMGKDTPGDPG
jgi:hypothetical protein